MAREEATGANDRDPFDLPARLQVLYASAFMGLWVAIVLLPLWLGSDFLYRHFYLVGAGLGLLSWPVVGTLGPRWAARYEARLDAAASATAAASVDATKLLRRARRAASYHRIKRASRWLILPVFIAVWVSGHFASDYDQQLIDEQPHQRVRVIDVHRSPIAGKGEGPDVTVDLNGGHVTLGLSFPGEDDVREGDYIEVVSDPEDPTYVIAADSHQDWAYSWWGEALLMVALGALGGGMWFAWASSTPAREALHLARRARRVTTATVKGVEGDTITLSDGSTSWRWTVDDEEWKGPKGGPVQVVGRLEKDAWPILQARRGLHWPAGPVDRMPEHPAEEG